MIKFYHGSRLVPSTREEIYGVRTCWKSALAVVVPPGTIVFEEIEAKEREKVKNYGGAFAVSRDVCFSKESFSYCQALSAGGTVGTNSTLSRSTSLR